MAFVIVGCILAATMFVVTVMLILTRYKRCPSNMILVKFGKVGKGVSSVQIHGGATFVWPVFQAFDYLGLEPINTDIDLRGALSRQNIRVNVPSSFTFAVGTTPELMRAAAERLLGMDRESIESAAREIIFGQLRATIATMNIEEINGDREKFESRVLANIDTELRKIGLYLINVNISDVTDESGYLTALGQEAAAKAVNDAKVKVAESDRDGDTGAAAANAEQRTRVADAEAHAVQGENQAAIARAASDAERAVREAESRRLSDAATAVQSAAAQAEGYAAERDAEEARAERDRASKYADEVVPAEVARDAAVVRAEGDKAAAVLAGEARGAARRAELAGEAEGLQAIVEAAGGDPRAAATLMIVQQLPKIVEAQAKAISGIEFGKIVVVDGGDASRNGTGATAGFLRSVTGMLPEIHEIARAAGITLPAYLGTMNEADMANLPDAVTAGVAGNGSTHDLTHHADEQGPRSARRSAAASPPE